MIKILTMAHTSIPKIENPKKRRISVLVCMVEDADTFLVKERLDKDSEAYRQFALFEEHLNSTFNHKLSLRVAANKYTPEIGQNVMALREGKWYRGIVRNVLLSTTPQCQIVVVFFVDYGECHNMKVADLYPIDPGTYQSLPYQTKRIRLANVTPITLDFSFEGGLTMQMQECKQWDTSAKRFVQKVTKAAEEAEFECVSRTTTGVYSGNLFIALNSIIRGEMEAACPGVSFTELGEKVSLGEVLVLCGFATRSQSREEQSGEGKGALKTASIQEQDVSSTSLTSSTPSTSSTSLTSSTSSTSSSSPSYFSTPSDMGRTTSRSSQDDPSPQKARCLPSYLIGVTKQPNNLTADTACRMSRISFFNEEAFLSTNREKVDVSPTSNKSLSSFFGSITSGELPENDGLRKDSHHDVRPSVARPLNGCGRGIPKKAPLPDSLPSSPRNTMSPNRTPTREKPTAILESWGLSTHGRVYTGGRSLLTKHQLISDERDMRTFLNKGVCDVLSRGKLFIARLQNHAWPSIIRALSCCLIGGKSEGKTFGYVVPLVSSMINHLDWKRKKMANAEPSVIVVCHGWRNVQMVADLIRWLDPAGELKLLPVWGFLTLEAKKTLFIELLNGVDVLITTLPCLQRLTGKDEESTEDDMVRVSLERCSRLIFDDVDHLRRTFPGVVEDIIEEWISGIALTSSDAKENQKSSSAAFERSIKQCVVTCSSWSKDVSDLMKKIDFLLPNFIISSFLEAAIAAKTRVVLHYVKAGLDPVQAALKLIQTSLTGKAIVFTYHEDDLRILAQFLNSVAMFVTTVTPSDLMWELEKKLSDWRQSDASVLLLVCDGPVNPLLQHGVCGAETLIHLGVPPKKHQFSKRLSSMSDFFSANPADEVTVATCHVVLTDEGIAENSYIVEELRRFGTEIPSEVTAIRQEAAESIKEELESRGLCHFVKAYGTCDIASCSWRHHVIAKDFATSLPSSGEVTFDVLLVLSPARYLVRLSSYALQTTKIDLRKFYKILFMKLQEEFDCPNNRTPLKVTEKGVLCAVLTPCSYWARARVIKVDFSSSKVLVSLFLIDEGSTLSLTSDCLYELPEELGAMPPLAVEVYLCDIKPSDEDVSWTADASDLVRDLLMSNKSTTVYSGRIALSLGSTLWLSPVCGRKNVLGTFLNQRSIKSALLAFKFGVRNPNHMTSLRQLFAGASSANPDGGSDNSVDNWLRQYDDAIRLIVPPTNGDGEESATLETSVNVDGDAEDEYTINDLSAGGLSSSSLEEHIQDCTENGPPPVNNNSAGTEAPLQKSYFTTKQDSREYLPQARNNNVSTSSSQNSSISLSGEKLRSTENRDEIDCKIRRSRSLAFARGILGMETSAQSSSRDRVLPLTKENLKLHLENKPKLAEGSLPVTVEEEGSANLRQVSVSREQQFLEDAGESPSTDTSDSQARNRTALKVLALRAAKSKKQEPPPGIFQPQQVVMPTKIVSRHKPFSQKRLISDGNSPSSISDLKVAGSSCVCRHPPIYWKQIPKRLYLRLALPDVKKYRCRFLNNSVNFTTIVGEVWYKFDETLFSGVEPDLCRLDVLGSGVHITLEKQKEENWPRLLLQEGKVPWLHADLIDFADSEASSDTVSLGSALPWATSTGPGKNCLPDGLSDSDDTFSYCESESSSLFKFG